MASASVFDSEPVTRNMKAAKKSGSKEGKILTAVRWVLVVALLVILFADLPVNLVAIGKTVVNWFVGVAERHEVIVGIMVGFAIRHYLFRDEIWKKNG